MKRVEYVLLSASTMVLTALGIDIMLPAFGEVRQYFGLPPDSTATAQIIVFFFMGQVAQLFFGVISDRFGRLLILRIGFPLYIISGIAAAFAPTLEMIFAARFVSGMGASAVFMATIAGVRDRYSGDQMARMMSFIFTIFLFTPILAPFAGIAILSFSNWQVVFLTPPLFAILVFIWSFRLEESHREENRVSLNWKGIRHSVAEVLRNKTFLRYTTITTLLFSALSSYVASSERIVGEIYGKPELFAWIFAGIGALMSACALLNSRLSIRYGAKNTMKGLLIVYTVVAAVLFVVTLMSDSSPKLEVFFSAAAVLLAINLAIEPNSSSLALQPMGSRAGIASAIYGTTSFFIGAALGSIINNMMISSVSPLVVSFFICGVVSLVLTFADRRA